MPELLNPAGLLWLGLVPLLFVPYLLRQHPPRRVVPALFLFAGIEPTRRLRLGGKLELRPLFLLQLLLLLISIAALCRPALPWNEVRAALVVDDSASLATLEAPGENRFDQALRAADRAIARDPASRWDLFVLSPTPHDAALGLSSGQARSRLAELAVGSCPHPDDAALGSFFARLARQGYGAIHVVTDRRGTSGGAFQVHTVGSAKENLAITAVRSIRPAIAGRPALLNVVVDNFSARPATVPIRIEDADHQSTVRAGQLELAPHGSASFAAEVPASAKLRAKIDAKDALPLDDMASISQERQAGGNVLLVAADPRGLSALEKTLGIRLEVVPADRYRPELARGRDLVIFHRSAPAESPEAPTLYVLPPDAPFLPAASTRVDGPAIALPLATHPVARYLNSAALRPRQVLTFQKAAGWEPIALANRGPVMLARSGAAPAVVSGIDLLPYLGERNRPVSILTLNVITWLLHGADTSPVAATRCVPIGRAESNLEETPVLPIPAEPSAAATITPKEHPLWPALTLAALALLALEAWFHDRSGAFAWALRLIVAALLGAAWLEPTRAIAGAAPLPLVLVDVSKSVLDTVRAHALGTLGAAPAAPVTAFAARPVNTTSGEVASVKRAADERETDLEAALLEAANEAPEGGAAFLVSDGWETRGDARRALEPLVRRGIRVYPVAEAEPLGNDVELVSLSLPAESPAGRTARAELWLRNENPRPVPGRLQVRQGAKTLVHEDVQLAPGDAVIARPLIFSGQGLLEFTAEFEPSDPATDVDRGNDRAKAWVAIGGGRKILLVGHEPRDNRNLEAALKQRGFRVTSVSRSGGEPLPSPSEFAAVILNDVPASDLPGGYDSELREQVRGGRGLAMIGGPRSFGLGGYRGSPIEEALPVRMKERAREEPRDAVALVIDKSGSMREESRIIFAREAARQLVEHLKDHDRLAVIGFDREPFTVIPLSDVGEIRDDFEFRINRLKPSGGTRLYPALEEARRELLGEEAKRRHIIVLSDGLSEDAENAAGRRRYYDVGLALAEQGVTISTIALGRDADRDFLERLASFGRGAFHATADASSLPEIVLGEFEQHGREKTLAEREFHPLPSRESPLVGELAASEPRWPMVGGLVETELKREARRDVGVSESAVPLIASWEYGHGRAVAVATDADGRWSDRWVRWQEWSRLWSDVVRWLAPEERGVQARFAVAYRDGALEIDFSRFDEDPPGAVTARVSRPQGGTQEIPLERAAPGHYHGSFATRAAGDYRIDIRTARGSVTESPLGYTIAESATIEKPRREPNWQLLEEIARTTGGEVNPRPGHVKPAPAPEKRIPLAPFLLPAAMAIFLLELVVRKLRAS